jgi:hypothetical protein
MSAPDRLRSLVAEATPGPWYVKTYDFIPGRWWVEGPKAEGYECEVGKADATLLALAPQLAELCADMGKWVARQEVGLLEAAGGSALLIRLDALMEEE